MPTGLVNLRPDIQIYPKMPDKAATSSAVMGSGENYIRNRKKILFDKRYMSFYYIGQFLRT